MSPTKEKKRKANSLRSLPGKILAVCICLLPFLTREIAVALPESVRSAYFYPAGQTSVNDFEQYCREIALLMIAAVFGIWTLAELLRRKPKLSQKHSHGAMLLLLAGYLGLGLASTLHSAYLPEALMGIHQVYEGYLALASYGIVFVAAWYWTGRDGVQRFVRECLTVLFLVIGVTALLESCGIFYYNNPLVQLVGGLDGKVGPSEDGSIAMMFGNSDYLGMYCAFLLPVSASMISRKDSMLRLMVQILASVLLAAALLQSKVMSAILIGFGMTALFLLVWLLRSNWRKAGKRLVCGGVCVAIVAGGIGFVASRSGDTLSEKIQHTMIGMEQEETFRLLSMRVDGNALVLRNQDTEFRVETAEARLSADDMTYTCNDAAVVPQTETDGMLTFAEPALQHCQLQIEGNKLSFLLGYATPLQAIRKADGWQVLGIGGELLDQVPLVSENPRLAACYPYLNGRVFVWANTISVLPDCIVLGHRPATSLFYFNQNAQPAQRKILGTYVLYNKPHSWYLQMAQDTGLLSLAAVVGMLVLFLVCGGKNCFGKKGTFTPFRAALFFAVETYCLLGFFHDSLIYHAPMFWFLFGMSWRELSQKKTSESA